MSIPSYSDIIYCRIAGSCIMFVANLLPSSKDHGLDCLRHSDTYQFYVVYFHTHKLCLRGDTVWGWDQLEKRQPLEHLEETNFMFTNSSKGFLCVHVCEMCIGVRICAHVWVYAVCTCTCENIPESCDLWSGWGIHLTMEQTGMHWVAMDQVKVGEIRVGQSLVGRFI